MEDDLKQLIRSARKHVPDPGENRVSGITMPEIRHTSFDSFNGKKKVSEDPRVKREYQWAEKALRSHGSKLDRALMAVRDAARLWSARNRDPAKDAFYVSPVIARGWNLNIRQLSEGLKDLERRNLIAFVQSRKGRHVRLILKHQDL